MTARGARLHHLRIAATCLLAVWMAPVLVGQTPASAPPDAVFHAVSYVEARVDAVRPARAALTRYREARRQEEGVLRVEFFEQIGRPGHFAAVESWRDRAAFDARDSGADRQLLAAFESVRVSGYDQRPYKTLTTAPGTSPGRGTVFVVAHVDVSLNPQVPVLLTRLAETSRREPGNLRFDVLQHTMRANHFTVVEAWRSQEALDAHVSAPHTRQYRDELQPVTGSPLDERVYTLVE